MRRRDAVDGPALRSAAVTATTGKSHRLGWMLAATLVVGVAAGAAQRDAQGRWVGVLDEHPAIEYAVRPPTDVVARLNARLAAGEATLTFEPGSGYLGTLLQALDVPPASQMLVVSRTGVQRAFTSPGNPRALFYNESVAVGYIRHAPFLEVIAHDPVQGAVFYTLDQRPTATPALSRQTGCLSCHVATATNEVPGFMTRSLTALADGTPSLRFGSQFAIDHRTPFDQRWGGWLVTGAPATWRHRGNAVVDPGDTVRPVVPGGPLGVRVIGDAVDLGTYPVVTSDAVALAVFDHQAHALNLLTRLGWEFRVASHEGRRALEAPAVAALLRETVDYLTFADEVPLPAPFTGESAFASWFSVRGRRDARGRTLHTLDLKARLFRYPLSYTVESPAFQALPDEARGALREAIATALSTRPRASAPTRHSAADRRAALEILRATP